VKPIAIVTPTFNRLLMVKRSVESWLHTVPEPLADIWVIDNGSEDGTAEWVTSLAEEVERVKAVLLDKNFGTAVAVNLGWKLSGGGSVGIVKADSDIVVNTSGFMERILAVLEAMPRLGILGLRRKDLIENPYHPDPWYRSEYLDLQIDNETVHLETCSHIMGSFTAYNKSVINDFGYLAQLQEDRWPDPAYGYDDSLACYRMIALGFRRAFLRGWDDVSVSIDHVDPGEGDKPDSWNGVYTRWKQAEAGTWMARYKELAEGYVRGSVSPYYDAQWDFAITEGHIVKVID